MRFLVIILSLFKLTYFANVSLDEYKDKLHRGYNLYETLVEEENQYYTLNITWGINQGKVSYSVYFYNDKPKHLKIKIMQNNSLYTLPVDNRGDVVVEGFYVKKIQNLTVYIVDKDDHIYRTVSLPIALKEDDFKNQATVMLTGQNKGLEIVKLKSISTDDQFVLIIIGLLSIILISSGIILVLYLTKSGLFKKDENREEEMKIFYEQLEQTLEEIAKMTNQVLEQTKKQQNVIDAEVVGEEPKQVYKRSLRYDDEDIISTYDIKKHLQEKGFSTNYSMLTEEEKNKIMIELMIMRDLNLITNEQYTQEVIELWKKSM